MTGAVKARDGDSVRLGDAHEHEQTSKADQQKITFYEILESSLVKQEKGSWDREAERNEK